MKEYDCLFCFKQNGNVSAFDCEFHAFYVLSIMTFELVISIIYTQREQQLMIFIR
jgi:hypothetical protein